MADNLPKDVMGSSPPASGHSGGDPKYEHWCKPEPKGDQSGEFDTEDRRFDAGKGGMEGERNPRVPIEERERGDAGKGREAAKPFEAEEFDLEQFDKEGGY